MERRELINAYIDFFKSKKHKEIANASLIPENDPTVLFTTAGMHPLVLFILGEKHPQGKRLVNVQKCIRTGDIDKVGNDFHLTFFEMLGNWSLNDYWKEESIKMSFEFLTKILKFKPSELYITCFEGDIKNKIPKDAESAEIWKSLGIDENRIFFLGKKDNWWGPAGKTGPCGPDTEIFVNTGRKPCKKGKKCIPGCSCGRYFEIWNNVFMQYNKDEKGNYSELRQKTVDTGMGVERTVAMLNKRNSVYENPDFQVILEAIKKLVKPKYLDERSLRIISDHLRASVFILAEKICPGNAEQGYVLRRLIRRAIRYGNLMNIQHNFTGKIAGIIIDVYKQDYKHLLDNKDLILNEIDREETKFRRMLEKGINLFERIARNKEEISGKDAFLLYQSYGFPIEMTQELAKEKKIHVDVAGYEKEKEKHKKVSQTATAGRFKSGLADTSEETTKLHTSTHLLLAAMNKVLKTKIEQRGSNITPERARFDFSFDRKLSDEEVNQIESIINQWISDGSRVERRLMTLEEAKNFRAHGVFEDKYSKIDKLSVYVISHKKEGDISKEICAGPHVKSLKELQGFKVKLSGQKSVGSGVRRIKLKLIKKQG